MLSEPPVSGPVHLGLFGRDQGTGRTHDPIAGHSKLHPLLNYIKGSGNFCEAKKIWEGNLEKRMRGEVCRLYSYGARFRARRWYNQRVAGWNKWMVLN